MNLSEVRLHLTSGKTSLSQQLSAPNQVSGVFSRSRDLIAHACRARCPAHVGSIFNECVVVINVSVWTALNVSREDLPTVTRIRTPICLDTLKVQLSSALVISKLLLYFSLLTGPILTVPVVAEIAQALLKDKVVRNGA